MIFKAIVPFLYLKDCLVIIPKVSAFEVPLGKLEKIRKEDPVLSQVKIFGVAPACDLRGKCDGKYLLETLVAIDCFNFSF